MKTDSHKDLYKYVHHIYRIITKTYKQPRYPAIGKGKNKGTLLSNKKERTTENATWMILKNTMLHERSLIQKDIHYMTSFVQSSRTGKLTYSGIKSQQWLPLASGSFSWWRRGMRELSGLKVMFYIFIRIWVIGLYIYQISPYVSLRFVHFIVYKLYMCSLCKLLSTLMHDWYFHNGILNNRLR